jgi:Flp pilus assembly protein TadG
MKGALGQVTMPDKTQRGQELAEFALVFPLLFLLLMGIIDMGRATYYASVLHNSAREAARYGTIQPDDTAGIEARAEAIAVGIAPAELDVLVTNYAVSRTIEVRVAYTMTIVTPLIGSFFDGNTVQLGSTARLSHER